MKESESESHSVVSNFCDPIDYTVHGNLQDRILEWVAIPFSRDLPNPGIKPGLPQLKTDSLPSKPQRSPISFFLHYRQKWLELILWFFALRANPNPNPTL